MSVRREARVLLVTKGLGLGGAERLIVSGLRHLDRERFHVEVAYLLPWKDALVPELQSQGIPVHLLATRRVIDVRWILALRRLVRDRRIDLVHTHMPFVGIGARLALFDGEIPLLHTEHNLWSRYRLPTRVANLLTIGRNREVIAVSSAVADSMHVPGWLPVSLPPVEVILHGPELAPIRSGVSARQRARERLGLSEGDRVVGTVGNFTAKKDHDNLLRAARLLVSDHSCLQVVLIGSGPLEADLRRQVSDLGISDRVTFTGMRDDVPDLLPGLDVFVLSSRYEGLPIALLEAMASGVPVVATRVGGIPEVVTDGRDGLLVAPERPDELATAISRVLDAPELAGCLGHAGARRSREFDLASAVKRTQAIYESVLGSP